MSTARLSFALVFLLFATGCTTLNPFWSGTYKQLSVSYDNPEDWQLEDLDKASKYVAPEGNLSVSTIYIPVAANAEEAAMQAMQRLNPGFSREVSWNGPVEAKRGWDAIRSISYSTTPEENYSISALVHNSNDNWFIVVTEGDLGTLNKRYSDVNKFTGTLKVKGYKEEDLSAKNPRQLTDQDVQKLLSFVSKAAAELNIPGTAIGLVQNGEVIYEGGIGYANIEQQKPVDENTLFMVASNTKGMTTLLLSKLVEMGKVDWKDRVIDHYPAFQLGDTETTKSVLIEHLICACTGLPRKDLKWIYNYDDKTPATQLFKDLATFSPTSAFGDIFQYSNEMAGAAGFVAGHIAFPEMEVGAAFDKAMKEYVFEPLGMTNTHFAMAKALSLPHAYPYAQGLDEDLFVMQQSANVGVNHSIYALRPAGAAWSSVNDMLKYVQNELGAGLSQSGEQLFAESHLLTRRTPYVSTGSKSSYGMGLSTFNRSGLEVVNHGGALLGYHSNWYAIPSANVGLVVLTNSDQGWPMPNLVFQKLIELIFSAEKRSDNKLAVTAENQQIYLSKRKAELQTRFPKEMLDKIIGRYESEQLGEVRIYEQDNQVMFDTGTWKTQAAIKKYNDGTNTIVLPWVLETEYSIDLSNGKIRLTTNYAQDSYSFEKID